MSKKTLLLILLLLIFVIFPLLYTFFTVTFFTWGLTVEVNTAEIISNRVDDLIAFAKKIYHFILELLATILDLLKPLLRALTEKILGEGSA